MGLEADITRAVDQTWSVFGRRRWSALDRDDAKQEAWLACWAARDRYDSSRSAPTTFFSLVARQAIQHQMKRETRRQMESLNTVIGEDIEWISTLEAPEARNVVEDREIMRMVEDAMADLTPLQADTIGRTMNGERRSEIARDRGTSHQAVSRQLTTGLDQLREVLS